MNRKLGLALTAALLIAAVALAGAAYPRLSAQVARQRQESAQAQETAQAGETAQAQEPARTAAPETAAPQTAAPETAGPVRRSMAADFTCYDGEGNAVRLSGLRGTPVVVNFFASWCSPCRMEMPAFDALYARYGGQIAFMMVDLCGFGNDSPDDARAMIEENGWRFPLYFDTDGEAASAYAVRSIPTTLFISAQGELKGRHTGAMDEATLEKTLEAMLAESGAQ